MIPIPSPEELLPGFWRIVLPLPFELSKINVFLVRLHDGMMLVDCGISAGDSFSALQSSLSQIGFDLSSITKILLTHFHPDHIGLAPLIHSASNAPMFMHRADVAHLNAINRNGTRESWMHHIVVESGVPGGLAESIESCSADPDFQLAALPSVIPVEGGEVLDTALGPVELVWTPGHSPGHICLYFRESKTLVTGDHVLPKISPNITWSKDSDALGDYLASLDKIGAYDVSLAVPSHGEPFADLAGRVNELKQHHVNRCAQILAALVRGSETAHQLVCELWPRKLSPIHHWFALFEVLAHLEYLRRRDQVVFEVDRGICKWRNIK